MIRSLTAALALLLVPSAAFSQQVMFGPGWKEQRFSMFSSNDFGLNGETMSVRSDDTVSLMWTALPEALWDSREASWFWSVERSVPPTDLTVKGGDDRNLSLYFVFLPREAAEAARGEGVMSLLENEDARVLMYIWGGDHAPGVILESPYMDERGRIVIVRGAGTGAAIEDVNLARDHREAFGSEPENLVGIAVSADSDDTGTDVVAEIGRLRFR